MVISKMNRVFDRHGRKFFIVITAFIIIAFIGFFTPGFTSMLSPLFRSESDTVGTVFGEKVSIHDIRAQVNMITLASAAQYNLSPSHSGLRDMAQDRAFEFIGMLKAAQKMGLCVSPSQIADHIKNIPTFQKDGKFSLKKFNDFASEKLIPAGYNKIQLDEAMTQSLIIQNLYKEITDTVIVTPEEVQDYFLSQKEKFDAQYATFNEKDYTDSVKINDKELQSYFELNRDKYMTPAQYNAEIVVFDYNDKKADAQKEITDEMVMEICEKGEDADVKAELDKLADAAKDKMKKSVGVDLESPSLTYEDVKEFVEEKSDANKTNKFPSDELKKKVHGKLIEEKAKELSKRRAQLFAVETYGIIEQLPDKTNQAEAFKKVAQKEKDRKLVNSGWIKEKDKTVKGIGQEPKLIESVTKIYQTPPISDAIEGDKAAYVAFLTEKQPEHHSEFAEVKKKVVEDYKKSQAKKLAREAARETALKLSEALKSGKKFDQIKDKPKFSKCPKFTGKYAPAANGQTIAKLAASTSIGDVSAVEDIPDGAIFVYLAGREKPNPEDFIKQKDSLTSQYTNRKKMAAWTAFNNWVTNNTKSKINLSR